MKDIDAIQIPESFLARARQVIAERDEPLLEYSAPPYRMTIYACAWSPPEYELQTEPGAQEAPFGTWRGYAEFREMSIEDLLEEYPDLEEADLDDEISNPFELAGAPSGLGAGVYSMFETIDVTGPYECAETGEYLGEVVGMDGPAPGNDYVGVSADSPLVLSCLQYRLDQLRTGIRIEVAPAE